MGAPWDEAWDEDNVATPVLDRSATDLGLRSVAWALAVAACVEIARLSSVLLLSAFFLPVALILFPGVVAVFAYMLVGLVMAVGRGASAARTPETSALRRAVVVACLAASVCIVVVAAYRFVTAAS